MGDVTLQNALAVQPHGEAVVAAQQSRDRKRFLNPYAAANAGYIDDVIEPRETRSRVIQALRALRNKTTQPMPRKHGNMPV